MTPAQLSKFRRLMVFAIVLALLDVCFFAALLWLGVIEVPR